MVDESDDDKKRRFAVDPEAMSPLAQRTEEVSATAAALRRIDGALGVIETAMLAVFLIALVGVGAYQAVASKFEVHDTWPFEVVRYSVFFIAMTGAALAAQRSRMINMDVVTRMLAPRRRATLRVATSLFVVGVCGLLIKGGMDMRDTAAGRTESYEVIPATVGLLALPLGAALVGLHFLLHAIIDACYLGKGKLPPEPDQKAH